MTHFTNTGIHKAMAPPEKIRLAFYSPEDLPEQGLFAYLWEGK
jgi:hypothetical protein